MQQVFISHTKRDQRDLSLAKKIAKGLKMRGVKVWFDEESIRAGSEWKQAIMEGVMDRSSHFLVILSSASIKSEWVLKEIELAKERKEGDPDFTILSLVTGSLADFPNKSFLDTYQWIPYDENLRIIMEKLAEVLSLRPTHLNQFTAHMDELTKDFVGREYVFSEIEEFLTKNPNGYFHLVGDPGVGKSAIMAELVSRTGYISHFILQGQGINTPSHFLESICSQLISRYELDFHQLPQEATRDGAFLDQLIHEASSKLTPEENLVIVIDALDEINTESKTTGQNILFLPSALPTNVYIILSSRPVPIKLHTTLEVHEFDMMQCKAENRDDTEKYLTNSTLDESIQTWITKNRIDNEEFIQALADKSENNFMYLKYVLGDIRHNRFQDLGLADLPKGLERYYEIHWERMGMTQKPLQMDHIRIVYILCEVGQPVSRELIADFAHQEDMFVQSVLDEWGQFLREQLDDDVKVYSLYHNSFRDFLHRKDIVQAAGVTIEGIHDLIASNLMETWKSMKDDI